MLTCTYTHDHTNSRLQIQRLKGWPSACMNGYRMQLSRHTHKSTHTCLPRLWHRGSEACLRSTKTSSTGCWLNDSQESKRKRKRRCQWKKVWVRGRSPAGSVSDRVLETHLLYWSLHWFLILPVVSTGFKTAGFLSLPPSSNTPSVHPPLPLFLSTFSVCNDV